MSDTLKASIPNKTTVLVMGGGPAGAMAAILLAREGIDAVVLEKAKFPRYHIGESLLNSLVPLLEFTDLYEKIEKHGFIKKFGGFFRIKQDHRAGHVDFRKSRTYKYSYQVVRSEFDKILLDHAKEMGAKVFEETTVNDISFNNDVPVSVSWTNIHNQSGSISFDYLVDATGLTGLMANKYLKNRQYQETFANIAIGAYWRNYNHYVDADEVTHEGAFSMEALSDGSGWLWAIPLHDGTLSVGAVIHKDSYVKLREKFGSNDAIYQHVLTHHCKDIHKLINNAEQTGDVKVWQDYSYAASQFAGTRYRLIGDAAGFIDPLFSSGVHLAVFGALSAAATICASMNGECTEEEATVFHDKCIRTAYTRFVVIVAGVYQQIQNQQKVVLPNINKEELQSAFDIIQPIVSGNLDMNSSSLDKEQLQKVIEYTSDMVLELHDIKTGNPVSKLMAQQTLDSSGMAIDKVNAIDGRYIRMKRGKLGLAKLGIIGTVTSTAKTKLIKQVLKNLDKKKVSKKETEEIL